MYNLISKDKLTAIITKIFKKPDYKALNKMQKLEQKEWEKNLKEKGNSVYIMGIDPITSNNPSKGSL